jgi:Tfp pilus assembly protein PilN
VIRVNLVPLEERAAQPHPSLGVPRKPFWISIGLCVAILLPIGGIAAMQRIKMAGLREDIARAEGESRRLKPQIDKIRSLEKERGEVQQRLVTVQGLVRDRYLPVQVMDELATATPEHLWLTKFAQKTTGELQLEGMTFSNLLVADLMMRMEEADIFEGVSLTVTERGMVGGSKVVKFSLTSKIKP